MVAISSYVRSLLIMLPALAFVLQATSACDYDTLITTQTQDSQNHSKSDADQGDSKKDADPKHKGKKEPTPKKGDKKKDPKKGGPKTKPEPPKKPWIPKPTPPCPKHPKPDPCPKHPKPDPCPKYPKPDPCPKHPKPCPETPCCKKKCPVDPPKQEKLKICGRVFWDCKCDGTFDPRAGDAGIAGVTVSLKRRTSKSRWVAVGNAVTNAEGRYCFKKLTRGKYKVFIPEDVSRKNERLYKEAKLKSPPSGKHKLKLKKSVKDRDFGWCIRKVEPKELKICGRVYLDCKCDGKFDPRAGDSGIEGVTVVLKRRISKTRWEPFKRVLTDEKGRYCFDKLDRGKYKVFIPNIPGVNERLHENAELKHPPSGKHKIKLKKKSVKGKDFGWCKDKRPPKKELKICGRVFLDRDCDGTFDPSAGDFGIEGVMVVLKRRISKTRWKAFKRVLTDEEGNYCFEELTRGKYKVFIPNIPGVNERLYKNAELRFPESGKHKITLKKESVKDKDFAWCKNGIGEVSQARPRDFWKNRIAEAIVDDVKGPFDWDQADVDGFVTAVEQLFVQLALDLDPSVDLENEYPNFPFLWQSGDAVGRLGEAVDIYDLFDGVAYHRMLKELLTLALNSVAPETQPLPPEVDDLLILGLELVLAVLDTTLDENDSSLDVAKDLFQAINESGSNDD